MVEPSVNAIGFQYRKNQNSLEDILNTLTSSCDILPKDILQRFLD